MAARKKATAKVEEPVADQSVTEEDAPKTFADNPTLDPTKTAEERLDALTKLREEQAGETPA
jgi:hypothetical protein